MTSGFGGMTLVCNARAGRGRIVRTVEALRAGLDERGLGYDIVYTERRGHGVELTRAALDAGTELIVAVGGDGTVHEVVNGMLEGDKALNPDAAFGVVAGGSGCDFMRTFGFSNDPAQAVKHLDGPESFPIDIGKVTYSAEGSEVTHYFANVANVGLGAAVVDRAHRLPRWLGPTRYFFAFWLAAYKHRVGKVVIDLVDRSYEGYMNNMAVANCQYVGGGMKIAPKAAPTDGLLDIQIDHTRRREAIALMPKVYKGEHVPHPDIEEAKRVRVAIEADRPLLIEADGEILGYTPARFEVLPDALRLKV
ncbi:MAG: diacylglycerol/lipid kinase family protein [Actinomycetota bacterium]